MRTEQERISQNFYVNSSGNVNYVEARQGSNTHSYSGISALNAKYHGDAERSDRLPVFVLMAFLIASAWSIPLFAVPGISWAIWPTPVDLIWVLSLPLFVWILARRSLRHQKSFSINLFLFLIVIVASFAFAALYSGSLRSISYVAYIVVKSLQAWIFWLFASVVTLNARNQILIRRSLLFAGLFASIVIIMESIGAIDIGLFVRHLPVDTSLSGPWAYRIVNRSQLPSGTLGYNHIYAGYYLATIFIFVLGTNSVRLPLVLFLLTLLVAIALTVARTAYVFLAIGITALILSAGTRQYFRLIVVSGYLVLLVVILGLLMNSFNDVNLFSLPERTDSISQATVTRFSIQGIALHEWTRNAWTLLFGVGMGHLGAQIGNEGFFRAHGQYSEILANLGIFGLALFFSMYSVLFRSYRRTTTYGQVAIALTIGTLVTAVVNDFLIPNPAFGNYLVFLFCLLGLGTNLSLDVSK